MDFSHSHWTFRMESGGSSSRYYRRLWAYFETNPLAYDAD